MNNNVELLVTLGINDDTSIGNINAFLKKVSDKILKVTYAVNVTKSNENIKNFIDKHQNKNLKVTFDVSKQVSNKNIKGFIDGLSYTKDVTFKADEKASKANFNTYLGNVSLNEANVTLSVNSTESKTKLNKFIDEVKLHLLPVTLSVNSTESKTKLNKFIDEVKLHMLPVTVTVDTSKESKASLDTKISGLKPNPLKVAIEIAQDSLTNLQTQAQSIKVTGVNAILDVDKEKTLQNFIRELNALKIPPIQVEVKANAKVTNVENVASKATQAVTAPQPKQQPAVQQRGNSKDNSGIFMDGLIGNKQEVIAEVKKRMAEVDKEVHIFRNGLQSEQQKFLDRLEKQGHKLTITRDAQTKEITQVVATIKNSANEVQSTVFKPLEARYDNLNSKTRTGERAVRGFVAETQKLDNKKTFNLANSIEDFNKKLDQAKHKGYLNEKQIQNIDKALRNVGNNNDIEKLEKQLERYTTKAKQQIEVDKMRNQAITTRQQLLANLTHTEQLYRRTVDKQQASSIRSTINQNNTEDINKMNVGQLRQLNEQYNITRAQIKNLNAEATEATKNSMGIISALKVAMEKFPIWMVASTAFYGTIATFRTFGEVIIDIDTKMTDLKKVMSEDTDFSKIFEQATESANTFGQTLSSTMDAYIQFAKQGYKGDELEELSNAGLVAGNVGDIDTGKASEYLTASILQWKKDTTEAMGVVDSWNEISNNFATTVENLAQGQAKAGATAKALGMDFDQLNAVVGTLNASTKQSGNEIGNFVKSVFPRLVSPSGQNILADLGVGLTDEQGNLRDIMTIYKEVAIALKDVNQADKIDAVKGLAGTYHISRMQTLLDDLASADSMYEKMYESSANSANSAMNENEKYMQSLQARINLAKVTIEEVALALGEAFITEGMVQGLQAFATILKSITAVISTVGGLPPILLSVVTILTLFSNRFGDIVKNLPKAISGFKLFGGSARNAGDGVRDLNDNVIHLSDRQNQNTRDNDKNTDSTNKNTEAKKNASKASKLLSVGFLGLGVASLAIGAGLEFFLRKIGEARQRQEEWEAQLKQTRATYTDNKEEINALADQYAKLEEEMSFNPDVIAIQEYQEVTNKLAELMPSLKKGEDAYGNAIIDSSKIVQGRINLLDEQIKREERLAQIQAKVELQEQVDDAFKTIEKRRKSLDDSYSDLEDIFEVYDKQWSKMTSEDGIGISTRIKDLEDVYKIYEHIQNRLENLPDNYNSNASDHLEMMKSQLESEIKFSSQWEQELSSAYAIVRENAIISIEEVVNANKSLSDSTKQAIIAVGASAIQYAETEEAINGVGTSMNRLLENDKTRNAIEQFSLEILEANNDTAKSFDELTAKEAKLKAFVQSILKPLGTNTEGYNEIEKSLNNAVAELVDYNSEVLNYQKETGASYEEALIWAESQEELNGIVADGADILGDYSSVAELLTGTTSEQIENVKNLVAVYESLSRRTNLSAQETLLLARASDSLKKLYPELNNQTEIRLDIIQEEINMHELLEEAYDLSVENKLSQEEDMTLAAATETTNRLAILREELVALRERNKLAKDYEPIEYTDKDGNKKTYYNLDEFNTGSSSWLPSQVQEDIIISQIEESQKKIEGYNKSLKTIIDNSNERDKANEKNEKSTDEVAKVTEKYALTLKQLDTALKNVQNKLKKYPTHSEAYRKALSEENQLISKQIALNEQKIKDLEYVARTASSSSSPTTTTASYSNTTSSYASGNGVKDQVWNFFKNKGLSDSAVAGIMGNLQQESNFNTSAVNEIGASGIAQWLGGRKTKLKNYASSMGTSWTDLNTQLEWLWKELNGAEATTKSILDKRYGGLSNLNNMSPSQAAKAFEDSFERSGGSALQKRMNNANAYYSQYAGKSVSNVSYPTTYASSGDSTVDTKEKALEEIEALRQTNISLKLEIEDNEFEKIKSKIEEFDFNRGIQDSIIGQESAKQENMLEYSKEYEKSLWVQYNAERKKLANYKQEYAYIGQLIKSGKLNALQIDEMKQKQRELNEEVQSSANTIKAYYESIISSRIARFDNKISGYQKTLDYEAVKIQTVDKASERYNKTLEILNKTRKSQVSVMQEELAYAKRALSEGNLTISMYEQLAQKVDDLTRELIEASLAIQQTNFDLIQNISSVFADQIDDIDYLLERSQTIMSMYEEKSGDYNSELMYQLELQNDKLLKIDEQRQKIQSEMLKADLSADHVKQLEEQLEDLTSQYWTLKASIVSTNKSIAESKKVAEEELMDSLDELADKVVEAYKAYIEEARDIRLDGLEKEMELEEERHDKVIKQYEDELDAFNKIIDARLKALKEEDNDRSYNKQMDKFAKEREEIVRKMNLVELDNSSEGKSQYKKLQEELAELDENIAEAQYERELEQTEKHYEELLTDKEELINDKIELEDKEFDNTTKLLEKEKAYYEKYYTDLLNDEKKFAELTALVHAQKFDEIEQEFGIMIGELEASLPDLLDTFDGTWTGVGASLRQNVINELKEAMDLFDEFIKKQEEAVRFGETITNENGSSLIEKDMPGSGDNGQLTEADLKVILAKFMTEKIAPNEKGARVQSIRDKAQALASEGRAENSTIASNKGINEIFDTLSPAQLKQVGSYFQNNSGASNFITRNYLDYIESYGKSLQDSKQITTADMQVLTAKYIKDVLNPKTSDTKVIADNSKRANELAQQGRSNGSLIPSVGSSFNDLIGRYSKDQQSQLANFMLSHASIISNAQLRDELIKYANQLRTSSMPIGLDTGGMTKGWGSTGGVDGKGGKYSILHQNEIVSNPIDTSRLLKISNILEKVHLASPLLRASGATSGDTININFGDIYEATANQAESFGKKIMNTIRKERGGKW